MVVGVGVDRASLEPLGAIVGDQDPGGGGGKWKRSRYPTAVPTTSRGKPSRSGGAMVSVPLARLSTCSLPSHGILELAERLGLLLSNRLAGEAQLSPPLLLQGIAFVSSKPKLRSITTLSSSCSLPSEGAFRLVYGPTRSWWLRGCGRAR